MGRPGEEEEAPQFHANYGFQYEEYGQQQQQPGHPQQFPPQFEQPPVQFPPPQPNGGGATMPNPTPNVLIPSNSDDWKTGLFDCMDDPMNAFITFFFPCITFGQIAEIIDNGQTSCMTGGLLYTLVSIFTGLPCIYACTYRTKLRSRYGLVESGAPDWLIHFICDTCALCQEYRELQHRGLDPSIGWLGNVAMSQRQQQPQMAPPMNQRMMP